MSALPRWLRSRSARWLYGPHTRSTMSLMSLTSPLQKIPIRQEQLEESGAGEDAVTGVDVVPLFQTIIIQAFDVQYMMCLPRRGRASKVSACHAFAAFLGKIQPRDHVGRESMRRFGNWNERQGIESLMLSRPIFSWIDIQTIDCRESMAHNSPWKPCPSA